MRERFVEGERVSPDTDSGVDRRGMIGERGLVSTYRHRWGRIPVDSPCRADTSHTTFNATETRILSMDSDSPVNARIAGQPNADLGVRFTAGNPRKRFTWARRTRGVDSACWSLSYRESHASHRSPAGQGYRP